MRVRTVDYAKGMAGVYVAAIVEYLITRHLQLVLGLAAGTTPIRLYELLANFYRQGESFAHVTIINLDEYVGLPADHPQSYR